MPLQAIVEAEQKVFENLGYDTPHSAFALRQADGSGENVYVPYVHPYQEGVPYDNYLVFLLFRSEYSENDIFEVYDRQSDRRWGWIFPLQALCSTAHKFSEHKYFLRFAQAAFNKLCEGLEQAFLTVGDLTGSEEADIRKFYSEDSIVLILYKDALVDANAFQIDDYLPCLFKFGYYLQGSSRNPRDVAKNEQPESYAQLDGRLRIEPISGCLRGIPFVRSVLAELLPYERNPILAFYYQYQIVELLLERVMHVGQQEFVNEVTAKPLIPTEIKESIERFLDKASEKKRLRLLFGSHLTRPIDEGRLRDVCNRFLRAHDPAPAAFLDKVNFSEYLYPVRNMLFHGLRHVDDRAMPLVETINIEFKAVVCDLLIAYSD